MASKPTTPVRPPAHPPARPPAPAAVWDGDRGVAGGSSQPGEGVVVCGSGLVPADANFHAVTAEPEASSPVELSAVPSQGRGAEDKLQVGLALAPGALPALKGLSKLGFVSLEIGRASRCVCLSSRT